MILSRGFFSLFGAVFLSSCILPEETGVQHEAGATLAQIQAHSNALRSAELEGSRLSFDFQHADHRGRAIRCRDMQLKVQVEYAVGGLNGVFQALPQQAVQVSCDDNTPFNLGIVVDNSGSQKEALEEIKRGAQRLADDVIAAGGQVSLTRVSTQASSLVELTPDRQLFADALSKTKVNKGWTALYDGIRLSSEGLGAQTVKESEKSSMTCRRGKRTAIAVFTDGSDNNSADEKHGEDSDGIHTTIEDLMKIEHLGSKVPVYTIGMGDKVDASILKTLAKETGGMYLGIDNHHVVGEAFDRISNSLQESVEVCADLPTHCGPLGVKVTYTYKKGQELITEQDTYETEVSCPAPAPKGRIVTVMMALSEPSLPEDFRRKLVAQSMDWVAEHHDKRVLLVLDDFHAHEHPHELQVLQGDLEAAGYTVDVYKESGFGLKAERLEPYDLVWFTNPGYPVDDLRSIKSLQAHLGQGGGVVISGDDISRLIGRGYPMAPLTGVEYRSNGVVSCGVRTNNGSKMGYALHGAELFHPVTLDLNTQGVVYRNDIDHTVALSPQTEVLMWGRVQVDQCEVNTPVVIAREFEDPQTR